MSAAVIVHEMPGRLRLRLPPQSAGGVVTAVLQALPGVNQSRLNDRARSVVVNHDGRPETRSAILRASAAGRSRLPGPVTPSTISPDEREAPSLAGPVVAGLATLGALILPKQAGRLLTLVNVAPTLAHGVDTFLRRGVKVQVLDALSIGVATWRGEYVTANAARFLLSLAGHIEESTAHRSDDLIQTLLHPNPETAWVERDGTVVSLPFADLETGDRVHVGAGELVPVDGVVASGAATVNQASVTGESLPIPKEVGAQVLSGTVLEEGRLVIIAERVGDATTTARISHFILEAMSRRGTVQRLAEQLADRRVWLTVGLGAAVFVLTRDARRLESMFLVDYSCALKLGSAVAVKSALYRGARGGILIKGGKALEDLAGIDTIVFDKTGTLTHGDLAVTDIVCFEPDTWPRDRLLAAIASVAEHSTHPVASAVVNLARLEEMAHVGHEEIDFFVGHGLSTRIAEGSLLIGSRHYLEDHECVPFEGHLPALDSLEAEGNTLLHIALDGRPLGVIALRDRPRAEAAATVRMLRRLGIRRMVMVTGDRRETALRVSQGLGLDDVVYEADPEHKARVIEGLKQKGATVAFVGDGVNDGPALITADIGIAMPMAADIARATAEVVLLENRLEPLADAIGLARTTLALIRRTFGTAVGVNSAIMAGASFGWLPPLVSSVLHNGTTIALLADALTGARIPTTSPGDRA